MGVRYLNKFLYDHCPRGMQYITFEQLRGSTIVVDISIYLYRFKATDELLSLIQNMLTEFIAYDIRAIFIFDGQPKQNKETELNVRKQQKEKAWQDYKKLIDNNSTNENQLQWLKQQCTKINKNDIANVKELMDKIGAQYTVAPYEADEVCAKLSIEKQIFCMSDDMDMLVYGCNRVLRNVNFITKTATLYKLDEILNYLQLSNGDFKRLCIISGTDYYKFNKNIFNIYNRYHHSTNTNLQDWLKVNITTNFELLETIYGDFDISNTKYEYLNEVVCTLK